MSKVRIAKDGGPIVFIGGMNAMPMMYAIELKRMGYEVLYIVDRPRRDVLSRPENHYPEISYPYPEWVIEMVIPSQIMVVYLKAVFAKMIKLLVRRKSTKPPQAVILNGFFISLSSALWGNVPVIALSHGSDLDTWAFRGSIKLLQKSYDNKSVFKYTPRKIASWLIEVAVNRQFDGFAASNMVVYFPKGFSLIGDKVLDELRALDTEIVHRFDISFDPLRGQARGLNNTSKAKLVIFSGVRFLYQSIDDGNAGNNKGNDVIIRGIAEYYQHSKNIEVHFVEKGPDVDAAKNLCSELGIADIVVWHKEMPFVELLALYQLSDICFDQVGHHWIGAIGAYALWLGKPLIANVSNLLHSLNIKEPPPIFNCATPNEIVGALRYLTNPGNRDVVSKQSMEFAEKYLGPFKSMNEIFSFSPGRLEE